MSSSPFKVTSPRDPGVVRRPDGRFAPAKPVPPPGEIMEQARSQGRTMPEVLEENKADLSQQQLAWPPAGPVNDGNKKPMKLGG